jgi:hypothetical protein
VLVDLGTERIEDVVDIFFLLLSRHLVWGLTGD